MSDSKTTEDMLRAEIGRLHGLMTRVMIGSNHLATHIDLNGPTWRDPYDDGLQYYGAGLPYDAWCCWKCIMLVREALEATD